MVKYGKIAPINLEDHKHATVAQLAEQAFRKRQVMSSNLIGGSIILKR